MLHPLSSRRPKLLIEAPPAFIGKNYFVHVLMLLINERKIPMQLYLILSIFNGLSTHANNYVFFCAHFKQKQEAVKASNSPRDGKDGIPMAKKIFERQQLFSNNDIFFWRYAFIRSDVGRRNVLLQLNASIRLSQNLNKMLHTVVYTKDLWHTARDLMVKYSDQPKIRPVLVLVRILVFIEMNFLQKLIFRC